MRKNDNPGYLPGSLPRAALCVALSSVLALGFTAGQLANPPQAHAALPFAIPAAAAAAGMGETECIAAASAVLAAGFGFSVKDYVGAAVDDIASWSAAQKQKAGELINGINSKVVEFPDAFANFSKNAKWKSSGSGPEPPQDPKDYNDSAFWRALVLVNGGMLGVSALGYFADGVLRWFDDEGINKETVSYPDLTYDLNGVSYTCAVSSDYPASPVSAYGDSNYYFPLAVSTGTNPYTSISAWQCYRGNSFDYSALSARFVFSSKYHAPVFEITVPSSLTPIQLRGFYKDSSGDYVDKNGVHWNNSTASSFDYSEKLIELFGVTAVCPQLAVIIDKDYSNTTEVSREYEIADAPSGALVTNTNQLQQWLNSISSSIDAATGKQTETVVRADPAKAPKSWPDSVAKVDEDLQPIEKPDNPYPDGGLVIPDDYSFPGSWTDGSINFARVFPFFFFDDIYTIGKTWFPQSAYDSKLRIGFPGVLWGKPSAVKYVTLDFSPWEPYRPIVYYGFLALVMLGTLARLFSWWTGFSMGLSEKE